MTTNIERIKGLYQSFDAGDVPTVLAGMDPNIEWNEAESFYLSDRNPYRGPEAIAEGVFGRIVVDLGDFGAHPSSFVDGGDTIVVEGRYKGTAKSTGTPVDAQFVHVFELANGKITRFQQYTDTAQWAKAMG